MICEACQAEIAAVADRVIGVVKGVVKGLFKHDTTGVDNLFKHVFKHAGGTYRGGPDLVPSSVAISDPDPELATLEDSGARARVSDSANTAKTAKRGRGDANTYPDDFEQLWKQTGRHGNKHPAFLEWDRIKHTVDLNTLVTSWAAWEQTDQWRAGFVPHLRKWIHVRGWQDTPPEHEFRGRPATPARGTALNAEHAKDWLGRRDDE